jgi:hypothetical protein
MQTSFTDLVGTAVVPAYCFDRTELTDLTPALNMVVDMEAQASEAAPAAFTSTGVVHCNP